MYLLAVEINNNMKKNQKSLTGEAIVAGENNSEIINELVELAQVSDQADCVDQTYALTDLFSSSEDDEEEYKSAFAQINDEIITGPTLSLDTAYKFHGNAILPQSFEEIKLQENCDNPLYRQRLIYCYENGKDTKKDRAKAYSLLKKLVNEFNDATDISRLAWYEFYGLGGGQPNKSKAFELWRSQEKQIRAELANLDKSLSTEDVAKLNEILFDTLYALAYCYLYGVGTTANTKKAMHYFMECFEITEPTVIPFHRKVNIALVNIFSQGIGVPKNECSAFDFRQRICNSTFCTAQDCVNLAACYQRGIGTYIDFSKALSYLEKGAEMGDTDCMNLVYYCYSYGIGTQRDEDKAKKFATPVAPLALKRYDLESALVQKLKKLSKEQQQ